MRLEIDLESLITALANDFVVPGVNPISAIENALSDQLSKNVATSLGGILLKPPIFRIFSKFERNKYPTIPALIRKGYETWYPEIRFSTRHSDAISDIKIEPIGFSLGKICYGGGVERCYELKLKKLKTKTNHSVRINHLCISGDVFDKLKSRLEGLLIEQPYIANPIPGPRSNGFDLGIKGFNFVSFDHLLTGQRYFCSCARTALNKMIAKAKELAPGYVPEGWPNQVIFLLKNAQYKDGLCHLCLADKFSPEYVSSYYGNNLKDFVVPYMDQLTLIYGYDDRTARGEVQQRLNISRWVQEAEMYTLVKKIFPEETILREASPAWLGRQRLDVYIPRIKLALEYQGEQHFRPISAFGGEEAFRRNCERDELKKRLCDENAVELVYVKYDAPLTLQNLRYRLGRHIKMSTERSS